MELENILISFFYMYLSSFPITSYYRDYPSSVVHFCLLSYELIDHKYLLKGCVITAQDSIGELGL